MHKKITQHIILLLVAISLASIYSCQSIPKGASVVQNFDAKKYVGTWYEIARIDFKQEKNLNNTVAQYALKNNGDIKVMNSGYNYIKQEWKNAVGNAKFRGNTTEGALKVSFFGPFYSGYNVFAVDKDYKYALVGGKNFDYLWILSREKTIPNATKEKYLKIATDLGYNVNNLLWVEHDKDNPNVK
jgi:apolipoprotein D and lipocalin family protein